MVLNGNKDIRWIQRFQNFEKSLDFLREEISIKDPGIIEKAGMIQFFEITFEVGWKMVKDYLEEEGFTKIVSPGSTLKKAFEVGLIEDGARGWNCF